MNITSPILLGWTGFELDWKAAALLLLLGIAFYFLMRWKKGFVLPSLYFSHVTPFVATLKTKGARLPEVLAFFSLLTFSLAFLDPHFFFEKQETPDAIQDPTEGIAIYLILDQSGSMKEEVLTAKGSMRKVDLLKLVTKQFILGDSQQGLYGRPHDMIGLIYFARGAHVLSPLTLDHASVLSQLANFAPVAQRDQDGTSIGYAIYKTANMITATKHYAQELIDKGEPAYTIKSTVMILITDGMQDPNPLDKGKRLRNMDIPEAAAYAKKQGIRLYIVNVEPKLSTEEYSANRNIMRRAAESTGGQFFMVDHTTSLEKIYQGIDSLEKSALPSPHTFDKDLRPDLYERFSLFPYLIAISLMSLLASIALDTTILRRIP